MRSRDGRASVARQAGKAAGGPGESHAEKRQAADRGEQQAGTPARAASARALALDAGKARRNGIAHVDATIPSAERRSVGKASVGRHRALHPRPS